MYPNTTNLSQSFIKVHKVWKKQTQKGEGVGPWAWTRANLEVCYYLLPKFSIMFCVLFYQVILELTTTYIIFEWTLEPNAKWIFAIIIINFNSYIIVISLLEKFPSIAKTFIYAHLHFNRSIIFNIPECSCIHNSITS